MTQIGIERFESDGPPDIDELVRESSSEGARFVERTVSEWADGTNRFDKRGEGFFLAFESTRVVGMCGVNIDPFVANPSVGRLRHLYVLPAFRRSHIGSGLVAACLDLARSNFDRVRTRTSDVEAARFYISVGFDEVEEESATHSLKLHQP